MSINLWMETCRCDSGKIVFFDGHLMLSVVVFNTGPLIKM